MENESHDEQASSLYTAENYLLPSAKYALIRQGATKTVGGQRLPLERGWCNGECNISFDIDFAYPACTKEITA